MFLTFPIRNQEVVMYEAETCIPAFGNIPPKKLAPHKKCKCGECGKLRQCEPISVDDMWVYWCKECYEEWC
jgi:hypothetical protein